MDESLKPIIEYLKLPKGGILDFLGPIIIIVIILVILFIAVRAQHWQRKIMARMKVKIKTKRKYERLPVNFKIKLSTMDDSQQYDAEVLDISAGGLRMLAPLYGIGSTLRYKIISSQPQLQEVGTPSLIVLRMKQGEEPNTCILRGKWIDMTLNQRVRMTQEIKERVKEKMKTSGIEE